MMPPGPFTGVFGAVLRCCARWGVAVVFDWWPELTRAPRAPSGALVHMGPNLHTAIDHDAGVIYLDPGYPWGRDEDDAVDLAHELAHCLVAEPPDDVDEVYSALFATEYAIGRACGLSFPDQVGDWTISTEDGDDWTQWGSISLARRRALLRTSRAQAVAEGLLDPKTLKMSYRRRWAPGCPRGRGPRDAR